VRAREAQYRRLLLHTPEVLEDHGRIMTESEVR
jgi:hypothetical protein